MHKEYTRQRQGRDFKKAEHINNTELNVNGVSNNIDSVISNSPPIDDSEKSRSVIDRLDRYKQEVERNAVPVDGCEPPEKVR